MTIEQVEKDLREAVEWNEAPQISSDLPLFKTAAKCNAATRALIKKHNVEVRHPLLKISKPINLAGILSNAQWHVTQIFNKEIAYRKVVNKSFDWCGDTIFDRRFSIITNAFVILKCNGNIFYENKALVSGNYRLSPPPLLPKNVVLIANEIRKHRSLLQRHYLLKTYTPECDPLVLYKPDTWQYINPDPALVAMVCGKWRVFAIWGDVVEQAEIISFQKS